MSETQSIVPAASTVHDADVIREMIRHEETLIISRAHWLVTLQAILFAGLAFSWQQDPRLSVTLIGFGIATALMFIPHLRYGNLAIRGLQSWLSSKGYKAGIDGPAVIGLDDKDVPWIWRVLLKWTALPIFFLLAWFIVAAQWVVREF
jgi:hypothetical protein